MLRWLAGVCLCLASTAGWAQEVDAAKAEALYKAGKILDALPMYEELAKQNPNEMIYQDHLAGCLTAESAQADDPAERKRLMIRAQEAAKRAVELGDTSYVIQAMAKRNLDALPPDGPMTPAQELMHEAEKSFAAGDFPAALAKYAQAADADPRLYEAPLYAGDAALKKGDFLAANKWYARAITVNPNRETAYRYSGDLTLSLATLGSPTSFRAKILDSGAKAKYLKAIVAEPYNQRSWEGIKKWAKLRNATLLAPKIDRPAAPAVDPKNPEKVIVPIESARYIGKPKDVVECWMLYSIVRADYLKERFKKDFPDEPQYRHTLKEESYALGMVVKTARDKNIKPEDMDESLRNLTELSDAGMLDCWILISAADRGIAQDYDAYRNEHRQLLHDYLDRFVVHAGVNQSQ
jgi:tetratricopeptide (TPR) repeat protein